VIRAFDDFNIHLRHYFRHSATKHGALIAAIGVELEQKGIEAKQGGHHQHAAIPILDGGRIGIAAMAVGLGRGALEESLKYSKERQQFGQPISRFQAIQWKLADMATEIEAGKHLTYHAAWLAQHGKPYRKEAAMAKLYCSELAMRCTIKAVQVHGGYGYTKDYPVERMMRDAKVCEIGEGSSEIQRIVISRQMLRELGA